jgi:prepilin-type N-terminal cleavage/methylation domain-containing protein
MRNSGITLIELLVVIAIAGILQRPDGYADPVNAA